MTELLYFGAERQPSCEASVLAAGCDESGTYIILNQTIFYPQGGGQPSDSGTIDAASIHKVRFVDDAVRHYSDRDCSHLVGRQVLCVIDEEKRHHHSCLHTAGHLLAAVVEAEYPSLQAVKGHHYPDGAYVEFTGHAMDFSLERINALLAKRLQQDLPITIQNGSPRYVCIGNYPAMACGGTHVKSLKELLTVVATKHKCKGDSIKISYQLCCL